MQEIYARQRISSLGSRSELVQSVVHTAVQSTGDDLLQPQFRHLTKSRGSSSRGKSSSSRIGRSRRGFGGGSTGGSIGSGIAIFIALVIIGVALFFAYKYYLRYKKKKGETAVEAPYQGGYHQGQMATGVPAASMKPDPAYQTTQYESNAMSDPSTAPPPLPSGDPNTLYQAAPAAPEQSPYTLYHPGAQQPAPPQYGQPPAQYGQPSAQNGQPPVQYGAAAPAAAAYPYANTAGYPSGPQHNSPAV